jgi:predicted DNA-binding protein
MLYVKHMIRTQVYLPKDIYQDIRLTAKKEKKPAAKLIRELLENALENKKQQANAGKALLELAKIGGKGPRDLSTNLDKYLYEE